MAIDDCCRFCKVNLRIKGTLTSTKKVFEASKALNEKTVFERLQELGLTVKKCNSRSSRICRTCLRLISRLESDLSVLRRWQEEEREDSAVAATSSDAVPVAYPGHFYQGGQDGTQNVQLLMVKKEELPPEQQERSPYPDQEENESPLIKEEQEEVWIGQRREQLQGLEEADTKVLFPSVHMKSENDEEEPESSLLHHRLTDHMETAAGGEDCGRPEPARSSDPERNLQAEIEVKIEASSDSGSGTEDEEDEWKETRDCPKRLNSATNKRAETVKSHSFPKPGETDRVVSLTKQKPLICSECGKGFSRRGDVGRHMFVQMKEKPFSCSECRKRFNNKRNLTRHLYVHTKEKTFSCSECEKKINQKAHLTTHMSIHSKEKPFSCSECGKRFSRKEHLTAHMSVHSKEKLFSCSECGKRFKYKSSLTTHECSLK
ncbi:uncharacterized protein LOC141791863 [Halichoeres trimaculatus]|uniref:uncharacterized protein LOC141791863 n=1 Tax=Halichoeres trimaculatus TaxID=147232 RepID=UPI003D9E9535